MPKYPNFPDLKSTANPAVGERDTSSAPGPSDDDLLDPAEIMRLPDHRVLILMPRQLAYPVLARKIRYWRERRWKSLWDRWRVEAPDPSPRPSAGELKPHQPLDINPHKRG